MALSFKTSISFSKFMSIKRLFLCYSVKSTPLIRQGKVFVESENEFAHNILTGLPQYKNSIVSANLKGINISINDFSPSERTPPNWETLPLSELCNKFENISVHAKFNSIPIADHSYSSLCKAIAKRSSEITDENLVTVLKFLSFWPFADSPKESNFYVLWKALDNTCLERWKLWDVSKILFITDLWFNLRLTRQSDFVYRSITKTAMNPSRLLPHQIVQLLFYLNVMRTISKSISMFNIEQKLESVVSQLSIEEIGIAAMGFFKTRNVIHSEKLMNHMIDRIMKESTTIPEFTLASLVKVLRLSLTIPLWVRIPELLDVLELQLNRLPLQCIIHINLLAAKCLLFHQGTLSKVTNKIANNIKEARLKDMEKILYPLTVLNFKPTSTPCIFETIMEEVKDPSRMKELERYPKTLVAVIYYLTLRDYFVESAASNVLDMNFIRQTYGKTNFMIAREVLGIDTYIELMCPSYTGPRLPVTVRNYLSKRYSTFIPDPKRKLSKHEQFTIDIFQTYEELLGDNCVIFKYLIPHHSRPDIVFYLNEDNQPPSIPDEYKNIEDFTGPVKAPNEGRTWYAVVTASRNMFLHNVPIVTGETSSKLQLLKKLGYKPIMVSYWDWPSVKEEKQKYLKKLLSP